MIAMLYDEANFNIDDEKDVKWFVFQFKFEIKTF